MKKNPRKYTAIRWSVVGLLLAGVASLAAHGTALVALHLLQSPKLDHFITDFPEMAPTKLTVWYFPRASE